MVFDTDAYIRDLAAIQVMGLPADDYLAGVPDVSRIAALRLAGNGVVPQHAETAFRELAHRACDCDRHDGLSR